MASSRIGVINFFSKYTRSLILLKNLIVNFIHDHADRFIASPETTPTTTIGQTYERRPIVMYHIGTGPRMILLLAGIHGNEVGTVKLAHRIIRWLQETKSLHRDFCFLIIPCLNIDGFSLANNEKDYMHNGRIGRLNARGVDLNRNFPTKKFQSNAYWNYGHGYSTREAVFAGTHGNSEPETAALIAMIEHEKIHTIFSFHNAGRDIMATHDADAQHIATIYSAMSGYRLMRDDEWRALQQTGTLKEWCEEHAKMYLEIETSNRYRSDWSMNQRALKAIFAEMLGSNVRAPV